jgi:hypothetical protein
MAGTRRIWTPPTVFPVGVYPSWSTRTWAQGLADRHFSGEGEGYDDEATLTLEVEPLCASEGAVRRHIDELEGEAAGKLVYGWVVRSDGHRLHTQDRPEGLPLMEGDLYCIDPLVPHWTSCPTPRSELIFAVAITPPASHPPRKIAKGLRLNVIAAQVEHQRSAQRAAADEAFALRGVG